MAAEISLTAGTKGEHIYFIRNITGYSPVIHTIFHSEIRVPKRRGFEMLAVLLTTLFTASSLLAASAIAASWRRYGRQALALRGEVASHCEWREVRVTIDEVVVRTSATVLRPQFKAVRRDPSQRALPAAA